MFFFCIIDMLTFHWYIVNNTSPVHIAEIRKTCYLFHSLILSCKLKNLHLIVFRLRILGFLSLKQYGFFLIVKVLAATKILLQGHLTLQTTVCFLIFQTAILTIGRRLQKADCDSRLRKQTAKADCRQKKAETVKRKPQQQSAISSLLPQSAVCSLQY